MDDPALNSLQNLGADCAHMLARCTTIGANSQKDSKLFKRKAKPKCILNQAHSVDDRLTVYAIAGGSARGLR
jgi:hypothetical protein